MRNKLEKDPTHQINSGYVEDMPKRKFEEIPEERHSLSLHPLNRRSISRVRRQWAKMIRGGYDEQLGFESDARLGMIRGFGLHTFDDRFFFAEFTGRLDFIRKWVQLFILRRMNALSKSSIRLPSDVLRRIVGYTTITDKWK